MNKIRRDEIKEYIDEHKVVTIAQLAKLYPEVSLMTIHRDLNYLQDMGFILKIRGGAKHLGNMAGEPTFFAREITEIKEKQIIATKALSVLNEANSIFLDAGTTAMALAKAMPNIRGNIITTGPNIALELTRLSLPNISLCGGVINKNNLTLSGAGAEESISKINIDTAFIVGSGYNPECGFTCGMESEADIKKTIIKKARTKILLIDTSKFGRVLPYTFAEINELDYIITELKPTELPAELLEAVKLSGTIII